MSVERFIVLPFRSAGKGRVVLGEMRQASTAASAERLADKMADRFAGVAAYSVMVDKESGEMVAPQLLRQHGTTIDLTANM